MIGIWDCFLNAAHELCAAGPVKQRLASAYARHLAKISYDEMPREVREEFVALDGSLSAIKPMKGETAVQATIRKMSDIEASAYCAKIISILGSLSRLQNRQPLLRAVNSSDDELSAAM